jgi:hypothetical protein
LHSIEISFHGCPPQPAPHAEVYKLERADEQSFQPLPFHYIEVAHLLFTAGSTDALSRQVFGEEQQRVRIGWEGGEREGGIQQPSFATCESKVQGCLPLRSHCRHIVKRTSM